MHYLFFLICLSSSSWALYVPSVQSSTSLDVWQTVFTVLIFVAPALMLVSLVLVMRYDAWEKTHIKHELKHISEELKKLYEADHFRIEIDKTVEELSKKIDSINRYIKEDLS